MGYIDFWCSALLYSNLEGNSAFSQPHVISFHVQLHGKTRSGKRAWIPSPGLNEKRMERKWFPVSHKKQDSDSNIEESNISRDIASVVVISSTIGCSQIGIAQRVQFCGLPRRCLGILGGDSKELSIV